MSRQRMSQNMHSSNHDATYEGKGNEQNPYLFERESDRQIDRLYDKVKELKDLTLHIGETVGKESDFLERMNSGMYKAKYGVDQLISKVTSTLRKGTGTTTFRYMAYVVMGVILFASLLYFWKKWTRL
jgi:hypothetical protein